MIKFNRNILLLITILISATIFTACGNDELSGAELRESNFSKLITYCESTTTKQTDTSNNKDYYNLSWTDSDSSDTGEVSFSLRIYKDKTILLTGISMFPYNSGIRNEVDYSVKFTYGSESENRLSFEVKFHALLRVLQSPTNYYPYIMDEYRMSDSKAIFDTSAWSASCYYETKSSKNNVISLSNPNETLRDVSKDSFDQIKAYLSSRVNLSLFVKD